MATHDDEADNLDLKNYKGIYANEDNGQKYQCPLTGAHFEVKDLCRRLTKVLETRRPIAEEELYKPVPQQVLQPYAAPAINNQAPIGAEMFTSSMVSEKLGLVH